MSNVFIIIKKEFRRFFTDRRLVISVLVIPGLLIFLMYSFMGNAITKQTTVEDDYTYTVYAENMPQDVSAIFTQANIKVDYLATKSSEQMLSDVANKEVDLYIIFPSQMPTVPTVEGVAPLIEIYYNGVETTSSSAYNIFVSILNMYESQNYNLFNINATNKTYNLATKEDESGMLFATIMPMLMMSMLFSACMAVAPESIAGEKERGTLATLLITPIKRWHLAIGKIVSLGVIAVCGGVSSFIGIAASLPKLMGNFEVEVSYGFTDYLWLLLVIASTVLIIVAIISVISAFSKSVKQATTLISPLMILSILLGLTSMFGDGASTKFWAYLIPMFNSVQAMSSIFSFAPNLLHIGLTVGSNIIYTALMILLLTKMFASEKIMFSK